MGKFFDRWLPIALLWFVIVVCVARPEIPVAIHNAIERWRWAGYLPPAPVPMPNLKAEPRQHRLPANPVQPSTDGREIRC